MIGPVAISRKRIDPGAFVRQYGRKAGRGDPNDRAYDRKMEQMLKSLTPEEMDRVLNGEQEDEDGDLG